MTMKKSGCENMTYRNVELVQKLNQYVNDGWSFSMSMSKIGMYGRSWYLFIKDNPEVVAIRARYNRNLDIKRKRTTKQIV